MAQQSPRRTEDGKMDRIRILLADDNPGIRELLIDMLTPIFDVIGEAVDGQALVRAAIELKPDVMVLDISMPVLTGIEAANMLRKAGVTARIVFLTVFDDSDFVDAAFAAGALGYVVKARMNSDLVSAIREVHTGRRFLSQCGA
jgi:DNA-binding NarL/FixJ family response regulator